MKMPELPEEYQNIPYGDWAKLAGAVNYRIGLLLKDELFSEAESYAIVLRRACAIARAEKAKNADS